MKTLVLATAVALIALHATAAPVVPGEISHKAQWVMHMDAARMRDTALGRHFTARLETEEARRKLDAFQAMVSFDPRTDLDGVTLYGVGGGKHEGVAILHGRFDGERLAVLVRANDTYEAEEYQGHTIHNWIDEKRAKHHGDGRTFGCIYGTDALLFSGSSDTLKHGLDVLDSREAGLAADALLTGLVNVDEMYFFSAAAHIAGLKGVSPRAAVLRNTDNAVIAIGEKDGVMKADVEMTTLTAEAALNLSKMLDGMIGMAILNAEGNPAIAGLARAMSVSVDGPLMSVSLELAVEDVLAHITKMENCKRKRH